MLLGYPKYGRLELWNTVRTDDAACHKDTKQFLTEIFAFKGQGLDFISKRSGKTSNHWPLGVWKAKT